ncbi:MAG TPA: hypothetical protein VHL11_04075 [Phototrophicaceae bacterium]|nr:hypothetical protein [Phototrophicaceae bacterium]
MDGSVILLEDIDGDLYMATPATTPLAFTSEDEGTLEFFVYDYENYDLKTFYIDIASGTVSEDADTDERLNTLLGQFREYKEQASYSPDHRYAATLTDTSLSIIDILEEKELLKIESTASFVKFSPDSNMAYLSTLDEPDNMENNNTTTTIYTLPDTKAVQPLPVPAFLIFPSPDGRYLAAQFGADADKLGIVDLATGAVSPTLDMWEKPAKVMKCLNTGNDTSDVDFTSSGRLYLIDLQWLPDSSGFIALNSYSGDGAQGGGSTCEFNYSRLRQYHVE